MKQHYELVPLGGIRGSANRMVRQLDGGFYGVGCMHPAVECMASHATKLLTHYSCKTTVGCMLQNSWHLLTLELGMGASLSLADFLQHEAWTTNSWLENLWEKACISRIQFTEGKLNLAPPRTGDE